MLKAQILGNLGSDAELKYSAGGSPLLRCNVAANFRVKNDNGEWEDRTEWVRVTLFGARAESLSQYLTKGAKVYVDGRLEARPWTSREGAVRAGLEVIANDIELCSPRNNDGQRQPAAPSGPAWDNDDNDDALPF